MSVDSDAGSERFGENENVSYDGRVGQYVFFGPGNKGKLARRSLGEEDLSCCLD